MKMKFCKPAIDQLHRVAVCFQRTFKISNGIPYVQKSSFVSITIIKHQTNQTMLMLWHINVDRDTVTALPVNDRQRRLNVLVLKIRHGIPRLDHGSGRHERIAKLHVIPAVKDRLRTIQKRI